MLEYVYFDFKLFGVDDLHVSSLSDFLPQINDYNCKGFHDAINHATDWRISTQKELPIET